MRIVARARLPHLADEVDAPILVFEGDIPADTADQIRAQFEIVQTLFVERLGSGPANLTLCSSYPIGSARRRTPSRVDIGQGSIAIAPVRDGLSLGGTSWVATQASWI